MKLALSMTMVGLVLSAAAWPAHAQWVWKDENGHTVVSDQAPPTSVPLSRIVKSPRAPAKAVVSAATKDADAKDSDKKDGKNDAQKSVADRDLEYKKRQKEAAEADQKQQAEATKTQAMQENCTAMRGNLAGLQSGGRTARINEKGERTYLDDAQRQGEIAKTQTQIGQYCK